MYMRTQKPPEKCDAQAREECPTGAQYRRKTLDLLATLLGVIGPQVCMLVGVFLCVCTIAGYTKTTKGFKVKEREPG